MEGQASGVAGLTGAEQAALREFLTRLRALPGIEIRDVRLFGSRARGEGHEYSDVDVAVILRDHAREHRHRIYDLAFDAGLQHGVVLAPFVLDEARLALLRSRERRIAAVLDTEGISL
jgi:predicted nucleotidyltransferase